MADYAGEVPEEVPANPGADVEMGDDAEEENKGGELPFAEEEAEADAPRTKFIDYLSSPIITLMVGQGETASYLTAHQALLSISPFFAAACAEFADDGGVSILLPNVLAQRPCVSTPGTR